MTSSSSVIPPYTDTLFWIRTRSPMIAPPSTKTFLPRLQSRPMCAPARTCAWCQIVVPSPICAPSSTNADSCATEPVTRSVRALALVQRRAGIRLHDFELVLDPVEDLLVIGQ